MPARQFKIGSDTYHCRVILLTGSDISVAPGPKVFIERYRVTGLVQKPRHQSKGLPAMVLNKEITVKTN